MQAIKKIDVKLAASIMIALLSCIVLFHLLVLSGVVPFSLVWGGRLKSPSQMYLFETVSLTINLAVIAIVAIRGGYIRPYLPRKVVTFLLWVLVILFTLNAAGNLFSEHKLEMILFSPLALVSAALLYRMAIER